MTADADAVALSTDLTPTFYVLAGHTPEGSRPACTGGPCSSRSTPIDRRDGTEALVIASSYGAVYGVLRDNGARLFIADGVNNRDYAYVLDDRSATRVGVTALRSGRSTGS